MAIRAPRKRTLGSSGERADIWSRMSRRSRARGTLRRQRCTRVASWNGRGKATTCQTGSKIWRQTYKSHQRVSHAQGATEAHYE